VSVYNDPNNKVTGDTGTDGKASLVVPSGAGYFIEVTGMPYCRLKVPLGNLDPKVSQVTMKVSVFPHAGLRGKVWFKNQNGQVVPGNPAGVSIKATREAVTYYAMVDQQQTQPDGYYGYGIGPGPRAGEYTVEGTYNGAQQQIHTATICDECTAAQANARAGGTLSESPGKHTQPMPGPDFTFTIQMGGPPPGGGGGTPPPGGGGGGGPPWP